jgi:N-acylneuraminate cytidylyltransferase
MKKIAFIPVRGGSKSIPMKNIKEFCGKPLVYWNIFALINVNIIDEVIIATDSLEIEKVVKSFGFSNVSIYHRLSDNATDIASTESVILEYLNRQNYDNNDLFILVQATSPFTESKHFEEALNLYIKKGYDSMLTCARNYRFCWNSDGTSVNYDYRRRPRRQEFKGNLIENGAFYINKIGNILKYKNRLSGKIGIYEMPEYTYFELDEQDDWVLMESLMYRYILPKRMQKKLIKLFLSDVDGVLTDGGMYYGENGNELKKFNTRDGMAFELLRNKGIKTGIITSEITKIVENRAKKMKVDYIYQGKFKEGKLAAAKEICEKEGISLSEVAYIGDDINCYELLSKVGYSACPSDAVDEIKNIPDILILNTKGGEGVIREYVNLLNINDSNIY